MTGELLQNAQTAQTHVQESWAPVVIDERTLDDWRKLPANDQPSPQSSDEAAPKRDD